MIAVYCFSAYALATVGGIFSVIFSCRLVFELFKNRRYVSALLTAAVTALLSLLRILRYYILLAGIRRLKY